MPNKLIISGILGTLFLTACAKPTSLPPSATLVPSATLTIEPPTPTPSPSPTRTATKTHTPEPGFLLPIPESTPAASWNGIRIMPEAIAGEELKPGFYAFTTLASNEDIEQFYIQAMQDTGRNHIATGKTGKGGLFIVFDDSSSVSVIPIGDEEGTNYVTIAIP